MQRPEPKALWEWLKGEADYGKYNRATTRSLKHVGRWTGKHISNQVSTIIGRSKQKIEESIRKVSELIENVAHEENVFATISVRCTLNFRNGISLV